jgi:phage/plasmid primase-like uncharacterized protein
MILITHFRCKILETYVVMLLGVGERGLKNLPLRDSTGKLSGFQWIYPEGTKRFLSGGRKKGCCHTIGSSTDGNTIYLTEGYATGASVYMATQQTTISTRIMDWGFGTLKNCVGPKAGI